MAVSRICRRREADKKTAGSAVRRLIQICCTRFCPCVLHGLLFTLSVLILQIPYIIRILLPRSHSFSRNRRIFHNVQRPVLQLIIAFKFFCGKHLHRRQSARYGFEIIRLQELCLFRFSSFLIFHHIPPCIYSRSEWRPPALSSLSFHSIL